MDNSQLAWNEIREFAGLWTRGDSILGPPNSATIMSGCHPQPGGGLRPFFRVSDTRPATGIASDKIPRAFTPSFGLNQADHEFAIVVAEVAGVDWTSYGWYAPFGEWEEAGEEDGSATQFAGEDSGALADARQPFFTTFTLGLTYSAQERKLYLVIAGDTDADQPYYFSTIAGGPEAGQPAWEPHPDWSPDIGLGPITIHQSRLVIAHDGAITFSEPGAENALDAAQDTRFILPDYTGQGDARIAWMVSVPPSDFLVCTVSGNLYNIQGDLDDPSIRELGRWGPSVYQDAVLTPAGVLCVYPNDGVYLVTPDGGRQYISGALTPQVFTAAALASETGDVMGFGAFAYSNGYLFLPNAQTGTVPSNGALVYDLATQAWFTSTHPDDFSYPNPKHFAADFLGPDPGVWGMRRTLPSTLANPLLFRIVAGDIDGEAREQRNQTWEWQSQKFRHADGRQIEMREIEMNLNSGADATVTVTVTSDLGSQVQVITPDAGLTSHRLQFRVRGAYCQVNVKAVEDTTDIEAPTLELLRYGTRQGHLLS